MSVKGSPSGRINPEIDKTITAMLKEVSDKNGGLSLDDKLKVIDRALKLEALKMKTSDPRWGSAFEEDEDE